MHHIKLSKSCTLMFKTTYVKRAEIELSSVTVEVFLVLLVTLQLTSRQLLLFFNATCVFISITHYIIITVTIFIEFSFIIVIMIIRVIASLTFMRKSL